MSSKAESQSAKSTTTKFTNGSNLFNRRRAPRSHHVVHRVGPTRREWVLSLMPLAEANASSRNSPVIERTKRRFSSGSPMWLWPAQEFILRKGMSCARVSCARPFDLKKQNGGKVVEDQVVIEHLTKFTSHSNMFNGRVSFTEFAGPDVNRCFL